MTTQRFLDTEAFGRIWVQDTVNSEPVTAIYTVTVTRSRYGGTYEGSKWLAFPCTPDQLAERCPDWDGNDVACADFFGIAEHQGWVIGRGNDATAAYEDLVQRVTQVLGYKEMAAAQNDEDRAYYDAVRARRRDREMVREDLDRELGR